MAPSNKGLKFPPEVYSKEEIHRLLKVCSARSATGARNRALITVGYRAGLRCSEVLSLFPKDIDLVEGHIYVRSGKGGKTRRVGIDAGAVAIIQRWLAFRTKLGLNGSKPLFCTLDGNKLTTDYVRALMIRLGKKAEIEKRVHYHGLRHTFSWELSQENTPLKLIQGLLGHSRLETTAVYLAHLAPHDLIRVAHERPDWGGGSL
ncbi:MAG TPA: tyrosine-type recombinase/integrase [Candidatus Hydrogenedentes bacterium]|nr:tyrosine-type recombinase/integrase [Candidatus Hydrogenedentota bacterium]